MSNGKTHDRLIVIATAASVPVAIALAQPAIPIAMLFGGLFLSPDLDTISRPYRRWGILGLNPWYPYRKMMKHRGVSHAVILGTGTRLLYAFPLTIAAYLYLPLASFLVCLLVTEISAWVHLMADGKFC